MTAQRNDTIRYKRRNYDISETEVGKLFEPSDFGIQITSSRSTNLWRGYHCSYRIRYNQLFLSELGVYTNHQYTGFPVPFSRIVPENDPEKDDKTLGVHRRKRFVWKTFTKPIINQAPPPLNGIPPIKSDFFDYEYSDIKLNIKFTGSMIISRGFIPHYYVHAGFHPAWKYKEVLCLRFNEGRLVNEYDLSELVRKERETGYCTIIYKYWNGNSGLSRKNTAANNNLSRTINVL